MDLTAWKKEEEEEEEEEAYRRMKEVIERWQCDDASKGGRESLLDGLMDMRLEHVERALDRMLEANPGERDRVLDVRENVRTRFKVEELLQKRLSGDIDDEDFGTWCYELMELSPPYAERMFTEMIEGFPDERDSIMSFREDVRVLYKTRTMLAKEPASESEQEAWLHELLDDDPRLVELLHEEIIEEDQDEQNVEVARLIERNPGVDASLDDKMSWCFELLDIVPEHDVDHLFDQLSSTRPDGSDIIGVRDEIKRQHKAKVLLAKCPSHEASDAEHEAWLQELKGDVSESHINQLKKQRHFKKLISKQLLTSVSESWIPAVTSVDVEALAETIECIIETVLDKDAVLDEIAALKEPFERARLVKDWLRKIPDMPENEALSMSVCNILDEQPELLDQVYKNMVVDDPEYEDFISANRRSIESKLGHYKDLNAEDLESGTTLSPMGSETDLATHPLFKSENPGLMAEDLESGTTLSPMGLEADLVTDTLLMLKDLADRQGMCNILDEQPERLDQVYKKMVADEPEYEDVIRANRRLMADLMAEDLQSTNTLSPKGSVSDLVTDPLFKIEDSDLMAEDLRSTDTLLRMGLETDLVTLFMSDDDVDDKDMSLLSFLMDTDNAVLDQMLEKRAIEPDGQADDVLKGVKIIKMKKLLEMNQTFSARLQRDLGLKWHGPVQSDMLNRDAWQVIDGNYPTGGNAEKILRMVRPTDELLRTYEFVKCRLELVQLFNEVNGEDPTCDQRHADLLQEVEQILILIRGLQRMAKGRLLKAIKTGNEESVQRFLEAGLDPDYWLGTSVHSPLILAVLLGNERIAELFLQADCDVNIDDGSAMLLAIIYGHNRIVAKLIEAGAVVTPDNVSDAIKLGLVDIVETLLSSGVDLDCHGKDWLLKGLLTGELDVVKLLFDLGVKCVLDEEDLLKLLLRLLKVFEKNLPKLTNAITLLLHQRMLPVTWSQNDELAKHLARHGFIDLYRTLVLYCSPSYPDLYELPYKAELPYAQAIDYRVHRYITERQCGDLVNVDKWFPVISEIPTLPGYGNVDGLPGFKQVSDYCEPIIEELINTSGEWLSSNIQLKGCGSSAEGTKVGLPDEFDYQVRFHVKDLNIEDKGYGYCLIQREANDDTARMINRGSMLFHGDSTAAMFLGPIRDKKITVASPLSKGGGTASTEWNVRYMFDDDHCLDIPIDVVPVLHIDGWPTDARQDTWMMGTECLRAKGYAFVAKPPSRKSEFGKPFPHHVQQKMWRISFGHLEAKHLANMDRRTKDVYITCKALRDPDISHMMFKAFDGKLLSMSRDLITSYWLKMVFMFNVPEFLLHTRSLVEMVYIVYSQVERCISQWWLPFYWQPHINIVEGLSQDPNQCKQAARVMKRLVTGWYMRDGETDTVEEEDHREGGVYPYLPRRNGKPSVRGKEGYPTRRNEKPDRDRVDTRPHLTDRVRDFEGNDAEDDIDSDDEYVVVIYSRTTNSLRDPGYNAYSL